MFIVQYSLVTISSGQDAKHILSSFFTIVYMYIMDYAAIRHYSEDLTYHYKCVYVIVIKMKEKTEKTFLF